MSKLKMKKVTPKKLYEGLQKDYEAFRLKVKDIVYNLQYPTRRKLLTIEASDENGRINGITVPELITIVNLIEQTGENVTLSTFEKTVVFWAEKNVAGTVSVPSL